VHSSTRRLAAKTVETLQARKDVAALVARYRRVETPQLAGRMFEIMHALSFNLDAASKGSALRARVTEWAGRQQAAADLEIVSGGRVVGEVQAKLVDRASVTAHDLARAKYDGMQRLVSEDRLEAICGLLDKVLRRDPESLRFAEYADTQAHVTDRIRAGSVGSASVSRVEAHRAADDPEKWAGRQVVGAGAREVGGSALSGALAGGVVSGLVEAAGQTARVRAGETSAATAACTAAGAAAQGAVRSGVLSGLAAGTRIAAAKGLVPSALGAGTIPMALAGAVGEVAAAGMAMARGEIGAAEFAGRSCESTLQTALVWACATVGQSVIPVPVVGALVGGFVGQHSATVIVQGLNHAVAAAKQDGLEEERIALLEAEAAAAVETAVLLSEAERALGEEHNAYITATVAPLLDDALIAAAAGDEDVVKRLGQLAQSFVGQPVFGTVEEFDLWMSDPLTSLTLNPNSH
jgi:hypothetical protein